MSSLRENFKVGLVGVPEPCASYLIGSDAPGVGIVNWNVKIGPGFATFFRDVVDPFGCAWTQEPG
jgi:hypothetical protein